MKTLSIVLTMLCFLNAFAQKKGITVSLQLNSQSNVFKDNATSYKDRAIGIGFGARIEKKISILTLLIEPRIMYNNNKLPTGTSVTNFKTTYFQVPISINILSLAKGFTDAKNNESGSFVFGLHAGFYVGFGFAGSFTNGLGKQKLNYGQTATDNRSPADFGLHTQFSFGPRYSGFKGYIEVQKGLTNVIPTARITNGATRKLNALNVGCCFKINNSKK